DGPRLLPEFGGKLSEQIRRRPGDGHKSDFGMSDEGLEVLGVLLVSRAISKSEQQLADDHDGQKHLFGAPHSLGDKLLTPSQSRVGVGIEKDSHCQKDGSTCSKSCTAWKT